MRIGIDARILSDKHYAGIGQYLYEIIDKWKKEYPDNEYYMFSRREIFLREDFPENWHIVNDSWIIDNRKLWYVFKLPSLIKEKKIDVFWGPNFSLPKRVTGTKYVVTVHDLAIFKFKGIGEFKNSLLIKMFGKQDCKKSDKVIAVSEATANDVHEIFDIPDEKIEVCYNGVATEIREEYNLENVRKTIVNEKDYILFVSTIEPRKNINRLIEGYERYRDGYQINNVKLVIAGKKGWNCERVYERASESRYSRDIIFTGYVSEDEKAFLYKNAKCFIYPSLYEGFGIPVLEAFSYGVPVITTRVSSLPEVGGDAAFYLEEDDDSLTMAKLIHCIDKMTKEEKAELVDKMRIQRDRFSWAKCANETMKVISEV